MDDDLSTYDDYVNDTFDVHPASFAQTNTPGGTPGGNDAGDQETAAPAGDAQSSTPSAADSQDTSDQTTGGQDTTAQQTVSATSPDPTSGQLATPSLQLNLTPQDIKACNDYLDAHFGVTPAAGASPAKPASYQPTLDGKPVAKSDVTSALLPLTMAGQSGADPTGPLITQAINQLLDLVSGRLESMAAAAAAAAPPDQGGGQQVIKLPPNLWQAPPLTDAGGWQKWRSAVDPDFMSTLPRANPTDPAPTMPSSFWQPIPKPEEKPLWQKWKDAVDQVFKDYHVDADPFNKSWQGVLHTPDDGADDHRAPHDIQRAPDSPPDNN